MNHSTFPSLTPRRRLLAVLAALAVLALFWGQARAQAQNELVVAVTSIGNTLDPAVANFTNVTIAMDHVYDRILGFDENFEFAPAVATSWEAVDATTYVLQISDAYAFQNGTPVTAEDVVFSIERLRDVPRLVSVMDNIASVELTGVGEVTVKLVEAHSSTFRELMSEAHVYSEAYAAEVGADYASQPMGSGPYEVERFVPGDRLVLSAWADHPGGTAAIDRITFRGIEEDANRYIAVETGEAQFADISYHDLARAEANPGLSVIQQRTTNTAFISMNTLKPPFDNTNVRRAMAYATDKEGLATIKGGSTVIDSMTPSMFVTYYGSPEEPTFDLEKARQLLEAEGYGPSNPLRFEAWTYGGSNSVMEAYQAILSAIGVEMTIKNLEFGVFLEGMARGEYQMLSGSWNNTSGDPLSALENYWSGSYGSQNISFFTSERADELYELAKATADEDVLVGAAVLVQDLAAQEMPIIPTFSTLAMYALDADLVGVETYPSGLFSFRNASFE